MALLSVRNVTRRFGGIVAIDDVSLDVEPGQIVGLIGPNGAGKTTLFNVDHAALQARCGRARVRRQEPAAHAAAPDRAPRDRPHLPERRALPDDDACSTTCSSARTRARGRSPARAPRARALEVARLRRHRRRRAAARVAGLPFGTLKRVELARALVAEPQLLLLDEPAGGLNHEEVAELGTFIRKLREDFDLTVLLVEHHMGLVMGIADRIHVLDFGRKIAEGTPEEVQREPGRDRGVPRRRAPAA